MPQKIFYTKTAASDIQRLDTIVKKKIKTKIEFFAKKPTYYAKRLINSRLGTYRWRVGNYRIVFDMDGKNIVVLRVGHRREIYD